MLTMVCVLRNMTIRCPRRHAILWKKERFKMNMKSYLEQFSHTALAMNDIEILPEHIRVVMVNECAPFRDEDDFYGNTDGEYAVSLRSFFRIRNLPICLHGGFT